MGNNKNELKVIETADHSYSVYNELLDETYHSKHGALQESNYVFIKNGLRLINKNNIVVLEVGVGTGLNAALTCLEAINNNLIINYTGIEAYPLSSDLIDQVSKGYPKKIADLMIKLCQSEAGKMNSINPNFTFIYQLTKVQTFNFINKYDLIYFDAFAPDKQPEMWALDIFNKMFEVLNPGGILTTYCAKGEVKRIMKQAGFKVTTVEGPPSKREMTVAFKL